MRTSVTLSRKQSGNYILGESDAWLTIEVCRTPQQLLDAVLKLGKTTVIKKEYKLSQLKTVGITFTKQEALRAFDTPATKENIVKYFN